MLPYQILERIPSTNARHRTPDWQLDTCQPHDGNPDAALRKGEVGISFVERKGERGRGSGWHGGLARVCWWIRSAPGQEGQSNMTSPLTPDQEMSVGRVEGSPQEEPTLYSHHDITRMGTRSKWAVPSCQKSPGYLVAETPRQMVHYLIYTMIGE